MQVSIPETPAFVNATRSTAISSRSSSIWDFAIFSSVIFFVISDDKNNPNELHYGQYFSARQENERKQSSEPLTFQEKL
jgi:hypothetical protein